MSTDDEVAKEDKTKKKSAEKAKKSPKARKSPKAPKPKESPTGKVKDEDPEDEKKTASSAQKSPKNTEKKNPFAGFFIGKTGLEAQRERKEQEQYLWWHNTLFQTFSQTYVRQEYSYLSRPLFYVYSEHEH